MADRLPQYPMLPNFNNNNLLQQQAQQQQQMQHNPQQLQDNHPNLSQANLDQARAWQMQQMQQQFRPPGAADMNAANPQFIELMKRSQSINQQQTHAARAQHLNQQQQQQQFGMGSGMPQMNPGGAVLGGSAQQQSFHDTSSPHPQPSHIQAGFPNMGGMPPGSVNQPQSRNPQNLLQGFPPHDASRQLELIDMARGQQPQNGPVNINKFTQQQLQQHQLNQLRGREQQQQQQAQQQQQQAQQQQQFQPGGMNHSSSADMFPSPGMSNEALRRPSPHPGNVQQTPNAAQAAQQQPRIGGLSLPEMTNRLNIMRTQVAQHETLIHNLQQQLNVVRGSPQEPVVSAKIKEATAEMNKRKDYLGKLLQAMSVLQRTLVNGNATAGGSGQPSWNSHPNQPQPFDQTGRNQMNQPTQPPPPQLQPNPMQSSPSLAHPQSQANHLVNQGFVPPRSGHTPQHPGQPGPQHAASPFNGIQPPIGAQFPFPGGAPQAPTAGPSQPNPLALAASQGGGNFGAGQNLGMPLPLEKGRFEVTFKSFCMKRNLKPDPRLLSIENRPVELYRLHVEVLKEGGVKKVDQKDLWNVIGGRLGFVQFPGTDAEPAKAGPGAAQQMAHIYKEYLAIFDQWYITQAIENNKRQLNLQAQLNAAATRWSPQQMQHVVQMSHMSVAELHQQGVDEKTIQFVEANRASLQRAFQEQKAFQNKVRVANLTQPPGMHAQGVDQNGVPQIPRAPGMGSSQSFAVGSPQHNAAVAARQQQFLHQQQILQQHQQHQHQQQQQQQGQQQQQQGQGQPQLQGQNIMQAGRIPPQQQQQNISRGLLSADGMIQKIKQEYMTQSIPNMQPVDVPVEQRIDFNALLEQMFRQCNEADAKLSMIVTLVKQEDLMRKLIAIICTVQRQRQMLSTASNPTFIISFDTLKNMSTEMQRVLDIFSNMFNALRQQQHRQQLSIGHMPGGGGQPPMPQQQQQQSQQQHNPMAPQNTMMGTPDIMSQRPSIPQAPNVAGPSTQQQQSISSSLRPPPPVSLQPPPIKRGPKAQQQQPSGSGAVSTPSPAPMHAASTPVASTPTPTAVASSPPAATKSPKTRAPPKPKAPVKPSRKTSKAIPPPAAVAAPPAVEAAQPIASSSTANAKRPREEDTLMSSVASSSSGVANEPSPPKRAKTEWESPPSEAMVKKNEVVENIKTEEDATAFLEQMTELIKMAGGEGQSSLTTDISDTLEMILKGYGSVPDSADGGTGAVMIGGGEGSGVKREATPPPAAMLDAFDEFFDFSFGTVEDEDGSNSKAPTPDLVSSLSSTNPSPESNHESDVSHHMFSTSASSSTGDTHTKIEEASDPLRLGPWKDIDGGEGAYYQTNDWKWDSPMTSLEQPWAIFNS